MTAKALGIIEAIGLAAAIEAADAAAKAASVVVLGYENARGGGRITVKLVGDVGAVKAAVSAGSAAALRVGKVAGCLVIPRPHAEIEALIAQVDRGRVRHGRAGDGTPPAAGPLTLPDRSEPAQPRNDESQPQIDESQPQIDESQPQIDESQLRIDETQSRFDESQPRNDQTQSRIDESQPRIDESSPDIAVAEPFDRVEPPAEQPRPTVKRGKARKSATLTTRDPGEGEG